MFDKKIEDKNVELIAMKENIASYINMKQSQRGTFALAFEINNTNVSMINEAMVSG